MWINIHWKYKDGKADWASLTGYYYVAKSRDTAISAIIGKIDGTRFNGEGSGQSYGKLTGKLCDCFQQLEDIGKDTAICPAQQVIYLLKALKSNNIDLTVGISTVKNDLEPSSKAKNFKKVVSHLKDCVLEKSSKSFQFFSYILDTIEEFRLRLSPSNIICMRIQKKWVR